MHITQGTFSYLPELTDEEITKQIDYCLENGWPLAVEFTDDPHPRNLYWDMWGLPMFDLHDAAGVLMEVNACREAYPEHYIKLSAYDARHTKQTIALSFIVQRPSTEPGFKVERQEGADRSIRYSLHSYATELPVGERYANSSSSSKSANSSDSPKSSNSSKSADSSKSSKSSKS